MISAQAEVAIDIEWCKFWSWLTSKCWFLPYSMPSTNDIKLMKMCRYRGYCVGRLIFCVVVAMAMILLLQCHGHHHVENDA